MSCRRLFGGLFAAAALAASAALVARQADSPEPWAVGQCYRAFMLEGQAPHVIRVLEAPRGTWVRVRSDPMSPAVPGDTSRTPVWLNTALVFALQQIECSTFPRG